MELKDIKDSRECEKQGGVWLTHNKCLPKTIGHVSTLPTEEFCKVAKGDLTKISDSLELGERGIKTNIGSICNFKAIHVSNERGHTRWSPEDLETDNGWTLKGLTEQALGCAKNDFDKLLGSEKEQRQNFLDNWDDKFEEIKMTKTRKKLFMNGDDQELEEMFNRRNEADVESICGDTWDEIEHEGKNALFGDWKGDEHDNYDLGDLEWLYTGDARAVHREAGEALDDSEPEEKFTMQGSPVWSLGLTRKVNNQKGFDTIDEILDSSKSHVGFITLNNRLSFTQMRLK